MAPHSPYIYKEDCTRITEDISSIDHHTPSEDMNKQKWKQVYLGQLKCIDSQILGAISIIKRNDPNAIIVINSDHGTKTQSQGLIEANKWTLSQRKEIFGVLAAFSLPKQCQNLLSHDVTNVNIPRIILGCVSDVEIPLLLNKHFVLIDKKIVELAIE